MTVSIIQNSDVKHACYYIMSYQPGFKISDDYPLFFEGDEVNKRPLDQAKRYLKRDGATLMRLYKNGKYKEYKL